MSDSGIRCDELVGSSQGAQKVYDLIRRVANLPAFVLINGESGTGKELVARAIHNLGARANRPFVAVSCGAIPESLVEAELFGSEKGAYTGSTGSAGRISGTGRRRDHIPGRDRRTEPEYPGQAAARAAAEGVLPARQQSHDPTEGKGFVCNPPQPAGDGAGRHIPRRLLFPSQCDEDRCPGTARADRTTFRPCSRHILRKYAAEYGKPVYGIEPDAMEALMSHEWPGNVRELENVIQRAIIMTNGTSIGLSDLPEEYKDGESETAESFEMKTAEGDSFDELLHEFKVNLVKNAVQESNGNKSLAAKKLRISRAYLHRLIRTEPQLVCAA